MNTVLVFFTPQPSSKTVLSKKFSGTKKAAMTFTAEIEQKLAAAGFKIVSHGWDLIRFFRASDGAKYDLKIS